VYLFRSATVIDVYLSVCHAASTAKKFFATAISPTGSEPAELVTEEALGERNEVQSESGAVGRGAAWVRAFGPGVLQLHGAAPAEDRDHQDDGDDDEVGGAGSQAQPRVAD
jgi:hypothetical protein